MSTGNFFAVGKSQWEHVCELGLNHAVAFLVLARGSGRDNSTTRWSAESVSKYTGMAWRRAKDALNDLDGYPELIAGNTVKGGNPTRKLSVPKDTDDLYWLPNELVTGAGIETPPVARLRQGQNLEHLQAFVELYGLHDLTADGGLPRSLIRAPYDREHICDRGQFKVYGFNVRDVRTCWENGPLQRFRGRKEGEGDAWDFIKALESMGLMDTVVYLAEGDSPDAELIHALTGDEHSQAVNDAAGAMASELPSGFAYEAENYRFVLPVLKHIGNTAVVGVSRLTYRPHTTRTAAWFAQHVDACTKYEQCYRSIAGGDFQRASAA